MDPTGAAGVTVARRMVFTPGVRPCLQLVVRPEDIARLTVEEIVADLRTAASLCNQPAEGPSTIASLLPGLAPRPRRQCTLQIVDGDPDEPAPGTYLDVYPGRRHALNSTDPGQLRAFHKHVVASLVAMEHGADEDHSRQP